LLKPRSYSRRRSGRKYRFLKSYFHLGWDVLSRIPALSRWPVRQVFIKQMYFSGTESIGAVGWQAVLIGLVVITQINNLVGNNEVLSIKIMIWTLVRELGPLLSAVVIISRSSSAFASELSTMQVDGEIKNLRRMGISPISYLVMPRVFAMTLASITLTFYFQTIAISTGLVVAGLRMDFSLLSEIYNFFEIIDFREMLVSIIKSATFGILIALVSCFHGMRKKSAMTEVPQAVSQAVLRSLFAVLLAGGIITVVGFRS